MINKNNWTFIKTALSVSMLSIMTGNAFAADNNSDGGIPSIPPSSQQQNTAGTGVSLPPVQTSGTQDFYGQNGQAQQQQVAQPQNQQQVSNNQGQMQAQPGQVMPSQMLPASAPTSLPPLPDTSSQPSSQDYKNVMANYFSMTPDQIKNLRRVIDSRAKAASELPGPAPKPVTGSVTVSLSPGSVPPVIRPFQNTTTTFVVVDNTGVSWPVENIHVGDETAFDVKRLDLSPTGSSFTITPKGMYVSTNLILKLVGKDTPVVIDLIAGQKERDERVEVRVKARGPNATVTSTSMVPGTDSRLLPILDGVPPENGKRLKVNGEDSTSAWMVNGKLVVRTPLKIISPASNSFVSSSDGTKVYVFAPTAQLVGLNDGSFVNISVQGW